MSQKILRNSFFVFIFITIGKILSFVREIIFSSLFGVSIYTDAYFIANTIPSFLNTSLTMSTLVCFIPTYNKILNQDGKKEANKFASNLMSLYILFNTMLSVFCIIFSETLVNIISNDLDSLTFYYAVNLTKLLSISFPITIAVHVYINVSNAHQRYFYPQLLNILNNIIIILFILLFSNKIGIYILPISGVFAWIVQLLLQRYLLKDIYIFKMKFNFKDPNIKKMLILALPILIATAAEQLNLTIDNYLATTFDDGNVSILNYAQKLFNLINGTLTTALVTVLYPIFSDLYAKKNYKKLKMTVDNCIQICMLILIPISLICVFGSESIVEFIYLRGSFGVENILKVALVFASYSLSLIFIANKEIYTRMAIIAGNSKIPAFINIISIIINIILNFILAKYLGIIGLGLATSISSMIASISIKLLYQKRIIKVSGLENNRKILFQIFLSSLIMIIAFILILRLTAHINIIYSLGTATILSISVYLILLYALKNTFIVNIFCIVFKKILKKEINSYVQK